jgi:trans-2,3-dihydro-3-hydroxyanthranilate isomerase
MVPVQSAATLAKAEASTARWREHLADQWASELYLFCEEGDGIRARMFAPGMGIPEDPATGAAAAALAAYLAANSPDGEHRRTIQQGIEMGRPSSLQISWEKQDGEIRAVRVGGTAVRVAEGTLAVGPLAAKAV